MLFKDIEPTPIIKQGLTKLTVTLTISLTNDEDEDITCSLSGLSSPEDFKQHYSDLCNDKRKHLDINKESYPDAVYAITVNGFLHGEKITEYYPCLDTYYQFLVAEDLIQKYAPLARR